MIEIQQEYQIETWKYHKNKLIYSVRHESGSKKITEKNFSCNLSSKYNKVSNSQSFFSSKDINYLEQKLTELDKRLHEVDKSLLVLINFRNEIVNVFNTYDQRRYQYVRVVVRNFDGRTQIEESYPQNIEVHNIYESVEKFITSVIMDRKKFHTIKREYKNTKVMLSQQATGFFIHETIGHLLEEDIYQYFKEKLNEIKFPENFYLYDDPKGYENLIGLNKIDDYGGEISPKIFVRNGKIINHIRSKEGFARAEGIDHRPLARMRMLTLSNSSGTIDDVQTTNIAVMKIHSGQVIPANFIFELKGEGTIENDSGKIEYFSNLQLIGNIRNAIESIFFIGNDQQYFSADCSKKGQTVRVGSKAPSLGFICERVC